MTTNFGVDLSSLYDVDDSRTVTGVRLVAEDAYWRLRTQQGQGVLEADAPEYGYDLENAIGAADSAAEAASIPSKIERELRNDDRILDVTATVVRTVATNGAVTYDIAIRCETAEGPFALVGKADDAGLNLAVQILPGGI